MRYELTDVEWDVICRRIATRYEKYASNFLAMLKLAAIRSIVAVGPFTNPFCSDATT